MTYCIIPRPFRGTLLRPRYPVKRMAEKTIDNRTVRLLQLGRDWRRSWSLIENLTPDKLEMAKAASLLWVSGQENVRRGGGDDTHLRVCTFVGFYPIEE